MNEQNLLALLQKDTIDFTYHSHKAVYTVAEGQNVKKDLPGRIYKNLLVHNSNKTAYYLVMMPGDKRIDTKKLAAQLKSSRLSFASVDDLQTILNTTPGSVCPFSLWFDGAKKVTPIFDICITTDEKVCIHPLVNTASVVMDSRALVDWVAKYHSVAQVIDVSLSKN